MAGDSIFQDQKCSIAAIFGLEQPTPFFLALREFKNVAAIFFEIVKI